MAARGLGLGDRLALQLRNSPELVIAAFAGWKVGAAPIPVRWDLWAGLIGAERIFPPRSSRR